MSFQYWEAILLAIFMSAPAPPGDNKSFGSSISISALVLAYTATPSPTPVAISIGAPYAPKTAFDTISVPKTFCFILAIDVVGFSHNR